MAVAAEIKFETEPQINIAAEIYGLSMSAIRRVGQLSLVGASRELEGAKDQLRGEYRSKLFEGLKSDKEFGEDMEVVVFDDWVIEDGKVLAADGKTAIVSMVENGWEKSSMLGQRDPRMKTQAQRDYNDLVNARVVDDMASGSAGYNTRIVVSCFPKEAMDADGDDYWRKVGYTRGLNYIQLYHVSDEEKMVSGSLSFVANPGEIRQALVGFGVQIPESENSGNYINYALTASLSIHEAKETALKLQSAFGGSGDSKKTNTADILEQNRDFVDRGFDEMLVPVAESLAGRVKNSKTRSLISALLQNSQSFSPEVQSQLIDMNAREKFADSDARLLEQLIAYSVIEAMRAAVKRTDDGNIKIEQNHAVFSVVNNAIEYQRAMASFAQLGASAGRSYEGCGGEIRISGEQEVLFGQNQMAFGGKFGKMEDEYGSLTFKCKNGHPNTRPRGKLIDKCTTCDDSVKC